MALTDDIMTALNLDENTRRVINPQANLNVDIERETIINELKNSISIAKAFYGLSTNIEWFVNRRLEYKRVSFENWLALHKDEAVLILQFTSEAENVDVVELFKVYITQIGTAINMNIPDIDETLIKKVDEPVDDERRKNLIKEKKQSMV